LTFIENYDGPVHPHARSVTTDGREIIERELDGEAGPTTEQLTSEIRAETIRRVFEELMRGTELKPGCERDLGRKVLVLGWLVNSSVIGNGTPISLRSLARKLGTVAPCLSPISAEMSRRLGVRNCFQAHDSKSPRHHSESAGNGADDGKEANPDDGSECKEGANGDENQE